MRIKSPALAALVFLAACSLAAAEEYEGNMNLVLYGRNLTSDVWEGVDEHVGVSLTWDMGKPRRILHWDFGLHFSDSDETFYDPYYGPIREKVTIGELSAGGLRIWDSKRFKPYLGAGVTLMLITDELETFSGGLDDDAFVTGLYVRGGIYWRIGEMFNLGIDGRLTYTDDADLFGFESAPNYRQLGLLFGVGSPQ